MTISLEKFQQHFDYYFSKIGKAIKVLTIKTQVGDFVIISGEEYKRLSQAI